MPRIPVGKPLEPRYRKSGNTRIGYEVLIGPDGFPARAENADATWKRVVKKDRDLDRQILLLRFADDTELKMFDNGALYSRRLDDPLGTMRETEGKPE